jgi:lipopolysaccharide export LptBFGC system permease protein LptF
LAPLYLSAGALAFGMFALREQATSELGRRRDLLHDHLEWRRPTPAVENLVVWPRKGQAVTLRQYSIAADPQLSEARGLTMHLRQEESTVTIRADVARPLSGGRWSLVKGQRLEDDGRRRLPNPEDVLDELRFTPEDVELAWKAREHPMDLAFGELEHLLAREPTNLQYQTLLQYNLTFPLAGLVLLLVGLPFVIGDERGKAGERIARGFFLCVAYFGADFVARTLGLQGEVGPVFSGWLPLVLFGSLGVVLTGSMRS